MPRRLPLIAALLAFLMTPGSVEFVENVVHLVVSGHTAHAFEDAEHQPSDVEHGCSGPFHSCSCHHSAGFTVSDGVAFRVPVLSIASLGSGPTPVLQQGFSGQLYRPPIG